MTEDKKQVVSQLGFFFSDAAESTAIGEGEVTENDPLLATEPAADIPSDLKQGTLTSAKKTRQSRPRKARSPRKQVKTDKKEEGVENATASDDSAQPAVSGAETMFVSVTHQQNVTGSGEAKDDITVKAQPADEEEKLPKPRKRRVSKKTVIPADIPEKPLVNNVSDQPAEDSGSVDKAVDKKSKDGIKKVTRQTRPRKKTNENKSLDADSVIETTDSDKAVPKVENRGRKKTVKASDKTPARKIVTRKKNSRQTRQPKIIVQPEFDLTPPQFDLLGDPIRPSMSEKKAALSSDLLDLDAEPEDDGHIQIDLEELLSDHQIDIVESLEDLPVASEIGQEASDTESVSDLTHQQLEEVDFTVTEQKQVAQAEKQKIVAVTQPVTPDDLPARQTGRKKTEKAEKPVKPRKKRVASKKATTEIAETSAPPALVSEKIPKKISGQISGQAKQLSKELAQLQDQNILAQKTEMMIPDISDLFSDDSRFMGRGLFLHSLSEWWRVRGQGILPAAQSWDDFLPPDPEMGLDVDAGELWSHFVILKWPRWEKYPEFLFTGQKLQSFFSDLALYSDLTGNDGSVDLKKAWDEMRVMPKNWSQGQQIFYSNISELSDSARLSFLPVSKTTKLTPFPFAMCLMMLPFGQENDKTADHLLGVLHYRKLTTDLNK